MICDIALSLFKLLTWRMTHDDSADDSLSKIIDLENGSKNANPDISEIVTDLEFVFKSKVL